MAATRRFAAEQPAAWSGLLDRLAHATGRFLSVLLADGADVYQLFDSWAGMLEEKEYETWAQPYHRSIFQAASGVPRILFVKECPYLARMAETGAEVVSLGVRHDLARALKEYPHLTFQGNVDERVLRHGTPDQVAQAVRTCLVSGGGQRHIVNLSHGVGKETPVANFEAYVRAAKE
jgi:uroporphyrinogen decarboxylase